MAATDPTPDRSEAPGASDGPTGRSWCEACRGEHATGFLCRPLVDASWTILKARGAKDDPGLARVQRWARATLGLEAR